MLKACRQGILAEALKRYASASALLFQGGETNLGTDNGVLVRQGGGRRKKSLKNASFVLDRKDTLGLLDMGVTYYKQVRRCLSLLTSLGDEVWVLFAIRFIDSKGRRVLPVD
jgi:hypothetical protein